MNYKPLGLSLFTLVMLGHTAMHSQVLTTGNPTLAKTASTDYATGSSSLLPSSLSNGLSDKMEEDIETLRSVKVGDAAYVQYAECLVQEGETIRPATFCIKRPESVWFGFATKDPQFSWSFKDGKPGQWAHGDVLTYQTATQGVWQTSCHALQTRNGSQRYFAMWLENGSRNNARHKGATPKFKDSAGNVWILDENVSYIMDSNKQLSTMKLIKSNL